MPIFGLNCSHLGNGCNMAHVGKKHGCTQSTDSCINISPMSRRKEYLTLDPLNYVALKFVVMFSCKPYRRIRNTRPDLTFSLMMIGQGDIEYFEGLYKLGERYRTLFDHYQGVIYGECVVGLQQNKV